MRSTFGSRLRVFAESFAGPKATNLLSGFIILAFLSFGTTLNEVSETHQQKIAWTGIAYQSLIVSFSYFAVLSFGLNHIFKKINVFRIIALVILFFTTEVLRTVYVAEIGLNLGLISEIDWVYRVFAGGFTGVSIFGLIAIVLNDNFRHKQNLSQLQEASEALSRSASVTEEDIKSIKFEILNTIRQAIDDLLKKVLSDTDFKKDASEVVTELVRISDDVVRPLSHQLFEKPFEITQNKELQTTTKVKVKRIFELTTIVNPFHPYSVTLLAGLLLIGNTLFDTVDVIQGLISFCTLLCLIFLILKIAEYIFINLISTFGIIFRTLFIFFVNTVLALTFTIPWFLERIFGFDFSIWLLVYVLILANFVNWSMAMYSAISFARKQTLENLDMTNEKLNWKNARLGAQLSIERQYLATVIHRDVQGKLIAAAMKFQNDLKNGRSHNQAMQELKILLSDLTNEFIEPSAVPDILEGIELLNEVWEGIFKIEVEIDPIVITRISNDPICRQSLRDIISEFATNAVKHGKASLGQIELNLIEDDKLELEMTNNGLPIGEESQIGLGTRLAIQQCLSVNRKNLPDRGVTFQVILPIS